MHRALLVERTTRLLVTWLLALVLPLQGAALGVYAAKGPSHLHKAVAAHPLVLEDLRRWKPAAAAESRVAARIGHVHASAVAERHHHSRDDGSVMAHADETADADEALGSATPSVLALLPAAGVWGSPERVAAAHAPASAVLRSRCVAPLDRPPRTAA